MRPIRYLALLLGLAVATAGAQTVGPPRPGPRDLCPVCGMLIAKYPNWTATVVYRDGHAHHFDGARDLFKYMTDVQKYAPGHRRQDIAAIFVTDFYDLRRIDARHAWYVVGSDVYGPMGHELIPLASADDAREFMQEHHGRSILRFDEVTPEVVAAVEAGK